MPPLEAVIFAAEHAVKGSHAVGDMSLSASRTPLTCRCAGLCSAAEPRCPRVCTDHKPVSDHVVVRETDDTIRSFDVVNYPRQAGAVSVHDRCAEGKIGCRPSLYTGPARARHGASSCSYRRRWCPLTRPGWWSVRSLQSRRASARAGCSGEVCRLCTAVSDGASKRVLLQRRYASRNPHTRMEGSTWSAQRSSTSGKLPLWDAQARGHR